MDDRARWKGTNRRQKLTSEGSADAVAQVIGDLHQLPGRILHCWNALSTCPQGVMCIIILKSSWSPGSFGS